MKISKKKRLKLYKKLKHKYEHEKQSSIFCCGFCFALIQISSDKMRLIYMSKDILDFYPEIRAIAPSHKFGGGYYWKPGSWERSRYPKLCKIIEDMEKELSKKE